MPKYNLNFCRYKLILVTIIVFSTLNKVNTLHKISPKDFSSVNVTRSKRSWLGLIVNSWLRIVCKKNIYNGSQKSSRNIYSEFYQRKELPYGYHELLNTLWKVSLFGVFLVRIFPHLDWIRGDARRISPYSVRMRENTGQKNSKYRHFSRTEK